MIVKNTSQKTLAKEIQLNGIGLHSGSQIKLHLKPAEKDQGFVFIRTDLNPPVEVPALANYVSKTERMTTLTKDGVDIITTEHLLAALVGCSVNNCVIEIDGRGDTKSRSGRTTGITRSFYRTRKPQHCGPKNRE
jgi:UDP-3-O-[3-hydroxymyristoyl] N-acetylglucosamine deacetylase/3-hydroxyacyl-[acyl-carrier-protein] dehydratase